MFGADAQAYQSGGDAAENGKFLEESEWEGKTLNGSLSG